MTHESADDHDALSCPQCQGMAHACTILGGFGEAMQKMLDDGFFYRLGRDMAMKRGRCNERLSCKDTARSVRNRGWSARKRLQPVEPFAPRATRFPLVDEFAYFFAQSHVAAPA